MRRPYDNATPDIPCQICGNWSAAVVRPQPQHGTLEARTSCKSLCGHRSLIDSGCEEWNSVVYVVLGFCIVADTVCSYPAPSANSLTLWSSCRIRVIVRIIFLTVADTVLSGQHGESYMDPYFPANARIDLLLSGAVTTVGMTLMHISWTPCLESPTNHPRHYVGSSTYRPVIATHRNSC